MLTPVPGATVKFLVGSVVKFRVLPGVDRYVVVECNGCVALIRADGYPNGEIVPVAVGAICLASSRLRNIAS